MPPAAAPSTRYLTPEEEALLQAEAPPADPGLYGAPPPPADPALAAPPPDPSGTYATGVAGATDMTPAATYDPAAAGAYEGSEVQAYEATPPPAAAPAATPYAPQYPAAASTGQASPTPPPAAAPAPAQAPLPAPPPATPQPTPPATPTATPYTPTAPAADPSGTYGAQVAGATDMTPANTSAALPVYDETGAAYTPAAPAPLPEPPPPDDPSVLIATEQHERAIRQNSAQAPLPTAPVGMAMPAPPSDPSGTFNQAVAGATNPLAPITGSRRYAPNAPTAAEGTEVQPYEAMTPPVEPGMYEGGYAGPGRHAADAPKGAPPQPAYDPLSSATPPPPPPRRQDRAMAEKAGPMPTTPVANEIDAFFNKFGMGIALGVDERDPAIGKAITTGPNSGDPFSQWMIDQKRDRESSLPQVTEAVKGSLGEFAAPFLASARQTADDLVNTNPEANQQAVSNIVHTDPESNQQWTQQTLGEMAQGALGRTPQGLKDVGLMIQNRGSGPEGGYPVGPLEKPMLTPAEQRTGEWIAKGLNEHLPQEPLLWPGEAIKWYLDQPRREIEGQPLDISLPPPEPLPDWLVENIPGLEDFARVMIGPRAGKLVEDTIQQSQVELPEIGARLMQGINNAEKQLTGDADSLLGTAQNIGEGLQQAAGDVQLPRVPDAPQWWNDLLETPLPVPPGVEPPDPHHSLTNAFFEALIGTNPTQMGIDAGAYLREKYDEQVAASEQRHAVNHPPESLPTPLPPGRAPASDIRNLGAQQGVRRGEMPEAPPADMVGAWLQDLVGAPDVALPPVGVGGPIAPANLPTPLPPASRVGPRTASSDRLPTRGGGTRPLPEAPENLPTPPPPPREPASDIRTLGAQQGVVRGELPAPPEAQMIGAWLQDLVGAPDVALPAVGVGGPIAPANVPTPLPPSPRVGPSMASSDRLPQRGGGTRPLPAAPANQPTPLPPSRQPASDIRGLPAQQGVVRGELPEPPVADMIGAWLQDLTGLPPDVTLPAVGLGGPPPPQTQDATRMGTARPQRGEGPTRLDQAEAFLRDLRPELGRPNVDLPDVDLPDVFRRGQREPASDIRRLPPPAARQPAPAGKPTPLPPRREPASDIRRLDLPVAGPSTGDQVLDAILGLAPDFSRPEVDLPRVDLRDVLRRGQALPVVEGGEPLPPNFRVRRTQPAEELPLVEGPQRVERTTEGDSRSRLDTLRDILPEIELPERGEGLPFVDLPRRAKDLPVVEGPERTYPDFTIRRTQAPADVVQEPTVLERARQALPDVEMPDVSLPSADPRELPRIIAELIGGGEELPTVEGPRRLPTDADIPRSDEPKFTLPRTLPPEEQGKLQDFADWLGEQKDRADAVLPGGMPTGDFLPKGISDRLPDSLDFIPKRPDSLGELKEGVIEAATGLKNSLLPPRASLPPGQQIGPRTAGYTPVDADTISIEGMDGQFSVRRGQSDGLQYVFDESGAAVGMVDPTTGRVVLTGDETEFDKTAEAIEQKRVERIFPPTGGEIFIDPLTTLPTAPTPAASGVAAAAPVVPIATGGGRTNTTGSGASGVRGGGETRGQSATPSGRSSRREYSSQANGRNYTPSTSRTRGRRKSRTSGGGFWEGFPFNRPDSPIRQQILALLNDEFAGMRSGDRGGGKKKKQRT